jgi:outer membrane protein OmpA-like peptidoglycan-associated protein
MSKLFLLYPIFYFSTLNAFAQNLIPNPGFEEHHGDTALYWKQPPGKFYHFLYYSTPLNSPHTGSCFNGICMHSNRANEYLAVELKEPLKKDLRYIMSIFVRLDGSDAVAGLLDTISCYFDSKAPATVHGYLPVAPQVKFHIEKKDPSESYKWVELKQQYTASGGERFIVLGYYPKEASPLTEITDTNTTLVENDNAFYYAAPEKTKKPKRNRKNADEEFREEINRRRTELDMEQRQKEYLQHTGKSPLQFNVRYYFDDLYLGPDSRVSINEPIILNIYFETGKANLLPGSYNELDKYVSYLKENPSFTSVVHGHTDDKGDAASNQSLSENRAKAVSEYLISKGIVSSRLSYKGWGSSKPLNNGDKSKDRRVELEIIKNK